MQGQRWPWMHHYARYQGAVLSFQGTRAGRGISFIYDMDKIMFQTSNVKVFTNDLICYFAINRAIPGRCLQISVDDRRRENAEIEIQVPLLSLNVAWVSTSVRRYCTYPARSTRLNLDRRMRSPSCSLRRFCSTTICKMLWLRLDAWFMWVSRIALQRLRKGGGTGLLWHA